jgi:hypothetical protein
MGSEVRILVTVPDKWIPAPLPPLDLSQAPEVRNLGWHAWGPPGWTPSEGPRLVAACFGGDTRAWADEVEPFVLDRLRAAVSSTALRVSRVGALRVRATAHSGGVTSEWIDGVGDAEPMLRAKTFLGFVDPGDGVAGRLVGCFALCIGDLDPCQSSVEGARVEGAFVDAPVPTPAVRALVAMVHHPSATFASIAILSFLLGVVAVVTRKRPRPK